MKTINRLAADAGLLALRLTAGGLLAGHGAQKLFGSFGGNGLQGTAGWLESLDLHPGRPWALLAGGSELAGGLLTALGLLHPLGPVALYGPMTMAWAKVHAGKPIWATSGGAELPLLNLAGATALALAGPGRFSLDRALGLRVPPLVTGLGMAGVAAGIALGLLERAPAAAAPAALPDEADDSDLAHGASLTSAGSVGAVPLADQGVGYGGFAPDLPPELPELAKEVGADPPGAFPGWSAATSRANPRRADEPRGDEH